MPPDEKDRSAAVMCLIAAVFSFGSVPVFLRYLAGHLDVWTVNGVRYSIAALFWLPFLLASRRRPRARDPQAEARRSVWRDALVPAAINLVGQVLWGVIHYFAEASTVGFAIKFSFLFTILFGFLLIPRERALAKTPLFAVGAAVGTVGVAVMFAEKLSGGSEGSATGMLLILATTVFWGAYSVSVRRYLSGHPILVSFGVISLYTAGGLLVLMGVKVVVLLAGGGEWKLLTADGRLWGVLVVSALIGIAFSHVLYYRGIHGLGPMVATGVLLASPFVTALAARIWLSEQMAALQVAGGLLVVGGGAILVRAQARFARRDRPGRGA